MDEARDRLKIFIDADVLIAGAASPSTQSASNVILQLGSLTLVTCLISEQVKTEAIRNIQKKVPKAEDALRALIAAAVTVVDDPLSEVVRCYADRADAKDVPILAAAIKNDCRYLVTFNTRHYFPEKEHILVLRPGKLLVQIRATLAELG